ncbi:Ig-like domain-containing protein, partial [Klebsiella pneumoniae]|uniref:Ig-like domain-containing protein n=1 Tax=Klebsiella pneumoniae TaxID=573 RepID=UPI0021D20544
LKRLGTQTVAINTTYLIVVEYAFATNPLDATIKMFVNPALSSGGPAGAIDVLTATGRDLSAANQPSWSPGWAQFVGRGPAPYAIDEVLGGGSFSAVVPSAVASQPPTVALTAPTLESVLTAPATVTLAATAADSDGTVAKVEFYNGATKLGEDTTAPYELAASNLPAGRYDF